MPNLAEWRVLGCRAPGTWDAEECLTGAPVEIGEVPVSGSPAALFAQVAARGPGLHPMLVPLLDVVHPGGEVAWVVRERIALTPLAADPALGLREEWLSLAAALEALHERGQTHGAVAEHLGRDDRGRLRLRLPWPGAVAAEGPLTDHRAVLALLLARCPKPLPIELHPLNAELASRPRARPGELEALVARVFDVLEAASPGAFWDRSRSPLAHEPSSRGTPLVREPALRVVATGATPAQVAPWGVLLLAPLIGVPAVILGFVLVLGAIGWWQWAPTAAAPVQALHQPDRSVVVLTVPPGAEVWEGGTLLGRTPLHLELARPADVVVRAAGHHDRAVRIYPGEKVEVNLFPRGGLSP